MVKKNLKGGSSAQPRENWDDSDSDESVPAAAPDVSFDNVWDEFGSAAAPAVPEPLNILILHLSLGRTEIDNLISRFTELSRELQQYILYFIDNIIPFKENYRDLFDLFMKILNTFIMKANSNSELLIDTLKFVTFEYEPFVSLNTDLKDIIKIIFKVNDWNLKWDKFILTNQQIGFIIDYFGQEIIPKGINFYSNIIDRSKTRQFKKKYLDFKIYGEEDARADSSAGSLYYGSNSIEINDPNVQSEEELANFIIEQIRNGKITDSTEIGNIRRGLSQRNIEKTEGRSSPLFRQLRILWNQRNDPSLGIISHYDSSKQLSIDEYMHNLTGNRREFETIFPQLQEGYRINYSFDINDKIINICGMNYKIGDISEDLHNQVIDAVRIIQRGLKSKTHRLNNFYYSKEGRDNFYFVYQPGDGGILNQELLTKLNHFFDGLNGRLHITLIGDSSAPGKELHATFEHYLFGKHIKSHLYLNSRGFNYSNSTKDGGYFRRSNRHSLLNHDVTDMSLRKQTHFSTGAYSADSKDITPINVRRTRVYELLTDIMVEFLNSLFGSLTVHQCEFIRTERERRERERRERERRERERREQERRERERRERERRERDRAQSRQFTPAASAAAAPTFLHRSQRELTAAPSERIQEFGIQQTYIGIPPRNNNQFCRIHSNENCPSPMCKWNERFKLCAFNQGSNYNADSKNFRGGGFDFNY
jgi:hypothetical protein